MSCQKVDTVKFNVISKYAWNFIHLQTRCTNTTWKNMMKFLTKLSTCAGRTSDLIAFTETLKHRKCAICHSLRSYWSRFSVYSITNTFWRVRIWSSMLPNCFHKYCNTFFYICTRSMTCFPFKNCWFRLAAVTQTIRMFTVFLWKLKMFVRQYMKIYTHL